ncbi:MAG: hypothetical protein IJA14_02695 [Alphaproteobacteria bacterium]|nr:hypothetical protein [Alphaproteobacteria bacterium]
MKKIMCCTLCLLMTACSTEKSYHRENFFVTETEVTADMQKIRSLLIDYYRAENARQMKYDLKHAEIICKLFGKNNKKLDKEIDKFRNTRDDYKEYLKLCEDLEKSLKGLKLDYKQIIWLAKELEIDMAKVAVSNCEKFAPYKSRALEIVKIIEEQSRYENRGDFITDKMRHISEYSYDKYVSYDKVTSLLVLFISRGILVDSFLVEHSCTMDPADFALFNPVNSYNSFYPETTLCGDPMFENIRKAASDETISERELSALVSNANEHMIRLASTIEDVQFDIMDKIEFSSFCDSYSEKKLSNFDRLRYKVTSLVDENPKFEDCSREINKLAAGLAYKIYCEANLTRWLYKEFRDKYYSKINDFFANSVKIAEKLKAMINNKIITENSRYAHKRDLERMSKEQKEKYEDDSKNISEILEIAKIIIPKFNSAVDLRTNTQKEIRDALRKSFLKTRETYLKNKNL